MTHHADLSPEIHDLLDRFGRAVLERVAAKLATGLQPDSIEVITWRFRDAGPPIPEIQAKRFWGPYISEFFRYHAEPRFGVDPATKEARFWQVGTEEYLPEVEAFSRALYASPLYRLRAEIFNDTGRIVNPTFEQARWAGVDQVAIGLIVHYLERAGTPTYRPDLLHEEFDRYRRDWTPECVPVLFSFPLLRFIAGPAQIDLGNGLKIEPLTGNLKAKIWQRIEFSREMRGITPQQYAQPTHHLVRRTAVADVASDISKITEEMKGDAYRVLTALRLLHEGDVAQLMGSWHTDQDVDLLSAGDVEVLYGDFSRGGPQYQLEAEEIQTLVQLLGQLRRIDRPGQQADPLRFPLRRFNQGFHRSPEDHGWDDRLLDIVIALESLLLADNPNTELSFRFAQRGAHLLRKLGQGSPAQLYDFLKNGLYDLRSKMVHSGKAAQASIQAKPRDYGAMDFQDFNAKVQLYVRLILRDYVAQMASGVPPRQYSKQLEEEILAGL